MICTQYDVCFRFPGKYVETCAWYVIHVKVTSKLFLWSIWLSTIWQTEDPTLNYSASDDSTLHAGSLAFWALSVVSCSAMSLASVTKRKIQGSQFFWGRVKQRKSPVSFVMPVHASAWMNSVSTGRIFVKFHTWGQRRVQVLWGLKLVHFSWPSLRKRIENYQ